MEFWDPSLLHDRFDPGYLYLSLLSDDPRTILDSFEAPISAFPFVVPFGVLPYEGMFGGVVLQEALS
jgi:hypothetical protein